MTLLHPTPQVTREPDDPPSTARKYLTLGFAALCPLVAGYAVVAALLALVSSLGSSGPFDTVDVLLAAGPGWLAAAHVPIEIGGHPLGVLPLLLTLFLLLLAQRASAAAAGRLGPGRPRDALPLVASVAGTHGVFGLVVALRSGSEPVTAAPAVAFFGCAALGAVAALLGARDTYGITAAVRSRMDSGAALGIRAGLHGLGALFCAGALLLLVALSTSLRTAGDLLAGTAPGVGGGIGLVLLCVVYLPNAVIGATAFLLGPGFSIGAVQATPFGLTAGGVPGLPLLAALPESAARWWPALLALPVAAGALVGLRARGEPDLRTRMRAVSVGALVVGSACLVLAALAGGQLGTGAFTPVTVPAGLLAVAGFGWTAIAGALVVLPGAQRRLRPVPEDPALDPEPDEADVDDLTEDEFAHEEPDEPVAEADVEPELEDVEAEEEEFPPDELGPPAGRTAPDRD
jgi:hypothetical protein